MILVSREDEQLAVAVAGAFYGQVPAAGVEEDAVCFAAEPCEGIEDKDRMAERRAVGRIEAVCVILPVNRVAIDRL